MKFGGSSVGSAERIKNIFEIVKKRKDQQPVVVSSAVGGITDKLLEAGNKAIDGNIDLKDIKEKHYDIIKELGLTNDIIDKELKELIEVLELISESNEFDDITSDTIVSFGERMSTRILAAYFNKQGLKAKQYDAYDIGFVTDENFKNAEILEETYVSINNRLDNFSAIPIITGFIAKTKNGEITTLGRGGSDYSAAIIGAAIGANEIQIWTDVNGIMSADPRVVENAKTIEELSFDEASELAYFGAKVLHPKTILPAVEKDIPVLVLNTFEPDNKGSRIVKESYKINGIVKAISCKKEITIIDVKSSRMINAPGYLSKIFEVFKKYSKSVDMITTSEINVSMSVDSKENVDKIVKEIDPMCKTTRVYDNNAIIYVVGSSIKHRLGMIGKIFDILAQNNINIGMISQCSEKVSIGFVVKEEQADETVKILHKELIG
jgi:aspartate kinase